MPGDPQVSRDGTRVAYTVSETDWDDNTLVQHLYVVRTDGESTPRQLTRGKDSESLPQWSPDGQWLAFLTARTEEDADDAYDEDDDPKQQVWLLPMDGLGGEAEKLTDAPQGIDQFDWLPDSSGIVYLAREPRPKPLETAYTDRKEAKNDAVVEREEKFRHQIWRIDREQKKPKLICPGDLGIGEIAVSPDGKTIAYTTNYTGEVNDYHKADVWIADIETGKTRALTDGPGGKYHPQWRHDGSAILFQRSLDPHLSYSQANLYSVPFHGGPYEHLTVGFPHDLTGWHGVWQDNAGLIYVSAAVGTTTQLFRLCDGQWEPLIDDDAHIQDFHVGLQGGIAYVAGSASEPPELLWRAPDSREAVSLTDLHEDWLNSYETAVTEVVSWPSFDDLPIEGLLTYPSGYDSRQAYPLILSLHGGPQSRAVQSLTPYSAPQVYAAAGYAVLEPNYRGSEGYGDAFSIANRGDLGGGDYHDAMAGVDWAIRAGIADPKKLCVMGSSYGGYLTNWIISRTGQFKAAVSAFGIFSLATDFSNSQAPRWEVDYLGGAPWEKPDLYAARSPASFVRDIHTPVLILHGEGDPNTFISNSQEMYTALHLLGRTAQYVHYPREGHGFAEPQHRLDEMRRSLAWFDNYTRGEEPLKVARLGDKLRWEGWEMTVVSAERALYAGQPDSEARFAEVTLAIRDAGEQGNNLTLGPADFRMARGEISTGRSGRPVGLPISALGQKVLAEGSGWKFTFAPNAEERGLAIALTLAFRVVRTGGVYLLSVKDFPSVTLDIPPAEDKDAE